MANNIAMPQPEGDGAAECADSELDEARGGVIYDPMLWVGGVKAPAPNGTEPSPAVRLGPITSRAPLGG